MNGSFAQHSISLTTIISDSSGTQFSLSQQIIILNNCFHMPYPRSLLEEYYLLLPNSYKLTQCSCQPLATSANAAGAEQHGQHLSKLLMQCVQALSRISFFKANSHIYSRCSLQQVQSTETSLNFYVLCIKISLHGQLSIFRVGKLQEDEI